MSVLTVLRQHLREGGHYIQMQPVHLVVEALRVPGSIGFENRYGMSEVLFFLCRDAGKQSVNAVDMITVVVYFGLHL